MRFLFFCCLFGLFACKTSRTTVSLTDAASANIPDSVTQNRRLQHLHIGLDNYTYHPPMSLLPASERNYAYAQSITALPEDVSAWQRLESLSVVGTRISTLPASLGELPRLRVLDLSFNTELDIAAQLPVLARLEALDEIILLGQRVDTPVRDALLAAHPALVIHDDAMAK